MYCGKCGAPLPVGGAFCPNCGEAVIAQPQPQIKPQPVSQPIPSPYFTQAPQEISSHKPSTYVAAPAKKTKKSRKWLVISLLVVAAVIVVAVVLLLVNQSPQFEMEPDGSLYYDGGGSGSSIEIPMEFDGKADSFADTSDIHGYSLSYSSSLARFIKYHDWVFWEDYPAYTSSKKVICDDYTLVFAVNGYTLGADIDYTGGAHIINVKYRVYNSDGEELAVFEYLGDLRDWLE